MHTKMKDFQVCLRQHENSTSLFDRCTVASKPGFPLPLGFELIIQNKILVAKRFWWGLYPSSLENLKETSSLITSQTFLILFNSFWKKAILKRRHSSWLESLGLIIMLNKCFNYCITELVWHSMWPHHLLLFILQRTQHRCLQRPRKSWFFSIEP